MNEWRNRITRSAQIDPEQLLAHPLNARVHPKNQQAALEGSLNELGWVKSVLVQEGTDVVIDGHARVTLALRHGAKTIPVEYVDLSDDEANLALASIDPISAMAAYDAQKLDELLRDVQSGEASVQAMLAELAESNGVIPPAFDASQEWAGMPEFEHPDINSAFQVVVHFASTEDVEAFEQLIGQSVPRKSKVASSIWYPEAEQLSNYGLGYTADES